MKKFLFILITNSFLVSYVSANYQNIEIRKVSSVQDISCFKIDKNGLLISYDRDRCGPDVYIPASVKKIDKLVFFQKEINKVAIGESVEEIGPEAFKGNSLTQVILPSSIKIIGRDAFKNNEINLLQIPDSVAYISSGAFQNNRLTEVDLSEYTLLEVTGCCRENFDRRVTINWRETNRENYLLADLQNEFSTGIGRKTYLYPNSTYWADGMKICTEKKMRLATAFDFTKYAQYLIEKHREKERSRCEGKSNKCSKEVQYDYTRPAKINSPIIPIEYDRRFQGYSVFKYYNYELVNSKLKQVSRDIFYRLYNNRYPAEVFLDRALYVTLLNQTPGFSRRDYFWTSSLQEINISSSSHNMYKRRGVAWATDSGAFADDIERIEDDNGYDRKSKLNILCVKN